MADEAGVRRFVPALALAVLAALAWALGPFFVAPSRASAPAPSGALRIATWNLHNFPGPTQDLDRLADALEDLQADVLVLQEIHDVGALAPLLPRHRLVASKGAGSHGQHVVIAWDPARAELSGDPIEHEAVALGGRVRPMLEVTLATAAGSLTVLGVHLKAGADGLPLRHLQWITLAARLAELRDRSVALLGDFNVAGGRDTSEHEELARVRAILDGVGLGLAHGLGVGVGSCTAYWEGVRRDGWLVPSTLDLAFVSGDLEVAAPVWIGTACARHRCDPVHSTDAYPDPDLGGLGDHCPVVVDLR